MKSLFTTVLLLWVLYTPSLAQIYSPEISVKSTNQDYVGIGTPNPQEMLHVNGSIHMRVVEQNNNPSTTFGLVAKWSNDTFSWDQDGGGTNYLPQHLKTYGIGFHRDNRYQAGNGNKIEGGVVAYISSHFGIDFFSRNKLAMRVSWEAQNVGIGTANPSYKLHVNGSTYCTGAQWTASDIKLKKNITDYDEGLALVKKMRPIEYELKAKADSVAAFNKKASNKNKKKSHKYVSVVAQELQELAPDLVDEFMDDSNQASLAVNQTSLTYVLINAVKELATQVEQQQKLIQALQKK